MFSGMFGRCPPLITQAQLSLIINNEAPPEIKPEHKKLYDECFLDHAKFVREFFDESEPGADDGYFWGNLSSMHLDFCELEKDPARRNRMEAIAAPRGNAKTTFRAFIKPIHAIVYGYEKFILMIGYSADEAIDKTTEIRNQLLFNDKLREVYGDLLNPNAGQKDFVTKNGVRVLARSKGKQVRGLRYKQTRPTLIICDDIESQEGVNTPEQRAKTYTWFTKDVMGCRQKGGNVFVIGTILHQESLLAGLLKNPSYKRRKYKARISEHNESAEPYWRRWKEIYSDLSNENAVDDALKYYQENEEAMLAGTKVLWEGDSYYDQMVYIVTNGEASFYSEKQNEPFDPEKQILMPENCHKFRVIWPHEPDWPDVEIFREGFVIQTYEKDSQRPTGKPGKGTYTHARQFTSLIAFHDPALAESKKSDYGAVVVVAQDAFGFIYCLEAWIQKRGYQAQVNAALDMAEKYGLLYIYLEAVGFQRLLRPVYLEELKRRGGMSVKISGVIDDKNKEARIARLEPYFNNQWMLFHENINPILIEQLKLFPTTHDDGPDALDLATQRLRRPRGGATNTRSGEIFS